MFGFLISNWLVEANKLSRSSRVCYQNVVEIPGSYWRQELSLSRIERCLVTCRASHGTLIYKHQTTIIWHSTVVRKGNECWPVKGGGCFVVTMPPHIAAMGQQQRISHNVEIVYNLQLYIWIYIYFTLQVIYHVNARIARIFLIKILIFDIGVRGYDYSDKYSYYELQWELYWYHYTVGYKVTCCKIFIVRM